jgi:IstB-like ATP binding protein
LPNEFPRWLPDPTDEDLWRLVLADSGHHCDFVDLEALKQSFDLFPRVPRQLKTFVRSFWLLRAELERHDPDEIRWPLLVLTQLLKNASQGYMNALLADGKLLARLAYERASTIITTNLPFKDWGKLFHNTAAASAIADRLVHKDVLVRITGTSFRTNQNVEE